MFNSNPPGINNYIHYNVWDEITYPFPNFNGYTVDGREWTNTGMWLLIHVKVQSLKNFMEHLAHVSWAI